MADLSVEEMRSFVGAIVQLAAMAERVLPRASQLADRLQRHLGVTGDAISSTSLTLPEIERVNVQLALDAYERQTDEWDVIGLSGDIGRFSGLALTAMISGEWRGPGESARQFEAVSVGVDETLDCLRAGIVLTAVDGTPVALLVYGREHYEPEVVVEIVGADQAAADGFLRRLRQLMDEHNAFRGKVLSFSYDATAVSASRSPGCRW